MMNKQDLVSAMSEKSGLPKLLFNRFIERNDESCSLFREREL